MDKLTELEKEFLVKCFGFTPSHVETFPELYAGQLNFVKSAASLCIDREKEKDEEIKKLTEQLEKLLLGDLTSAADRFFIVREKVKESGKFFREFDNMDTIPRWKYNESEILEKLKL